MIKFFKEKGGYLIVESLIIIIGISVTFSFNNWKTESENRKKEQYYLSNFVMDINDDLVSLNRVLEFRNSQLAFIKKYFQYMQQGKKLDNKEIVNGIYSLIPTKEFRHNQINYQNLINSGQLNLIEDEEIIYYMTHLIIGKYKVVNQNDKDILNFRNNYVLPYVYNNYSFIQLTQANYYKNVVIKNETEFQNILIYNHKSLESSILAYKMAIKYAEKTKDLIKRQIKEQVEEQIDEQSEEQLN